MWRSEGALLLGLQCSAHDRSWYDSVIINKKSFSCEILYTRHVKEMYVHGMHVLETHGTVKLHLQLLCNIGTEQLSGSVVLVQQGIAN